MRFVVLLPPGTPPVDVVTGSDPKGPRIATALTSGTVTDYLPVAWPGVTLVGESGGSIPLLPGAPGYRYTEVVGLDGYGQLVAGNMIESAGHIDGMDDRAAKSDSAVILTSGYGLPTTIDPDASLELGTGARHCLAYWGQDTSEDPNEGGLVTGPGALRSATCCRPDRPT